MDWAYVRRARLLHLTGVTPGLGPACRALVARALREAAGAGVLRSFDINYRARLWSPEEMAEALTPLLAGVDLLFSTAADARTVFGLDGPREELAGALRERFGAATVVVTDEARAVALHGGALEGRAGYPVESVDRIGAGDAFAAGFIHGFLAGAVGRGLEYGLALAALKHTFLGDIAWATEDDVRRLISGQDSWR